MVFREGMLERNDTETKKWKKERSIIYFMKIIWKRHNLNIYTIFIFSWEIAFTPFMLCLMTQKIKLCINNYKFIFHLSFIPETFFSLPLAGSLWFVLLYITFNIKLFDLQCFTLTELYKKKSLTLALWFSFKD